MKALNYTMVSILLGLMLALPTHAQQTIFNVPSADVTPQGTLFLQHESQFRAWEPDSFWLGTHYTAYGIGHNTELGATLINLSAPPSNNVSLMLGFKSAIPVLTNPFPEREFKITVGASTPISFQGRGVGAWVYSHLSSRLPTLKTRLTAGISGGTENLFGRDTVHFIGGYEQPITKRFSLIGDWFSGTHANGFFIPGFSFALTKSTNIYFGYQVPNNTKCGRSGIVFELAKFF
jgi:hypothetical protein